MGFLDRILKVGARAAERAVSNAVNDVVYDTVNKGLRGIKNDKQPSSNKSSSTTNSSTRSSSSASASRAADSDDRPFEQKLREVLAKIGNFEIRENISPDVIESEAGYELYKRGGCYCLPKDISYAIYKDGQRVLFINTWWSYPQYLHVADRAIKDYCDQYGTPMLDFFEYMPNEVKYMEDRIRKAIG